MEPVTALTAIREARPIAVIAYNGDALDWWHRTVNAPAPVVKQQRRDVATWHRDNGLDVDNISRMMRNNEEDGATVSGMEPE
jgi:hypothetical protein